MHHPPWTTPHLINRGAATASIACMRGEGVGDGDSDLQMSVGGKIRWVPRDPTPVSPGVGCVAWQKDGLDQNNILIVSDPRDS